MNLTSLFSGPVERTSPIYIPLIDGVRERGRLQPIIGTGVPEDPFYLRIREFDILHPHVSSLENVGKQEKVVLQS